MSLRSVLTFAVGVGAIGRPVVHPSPHLQGEVGPRPSNFKRAAVVLLALLLMGSIGSMAQSAPPPINAANALTSVADAVESSLRGLATGGGVMEIGRALFGFFVVANLVWMLLKSYVSGTGFFNGFIADLAPFAVMCGVVAIFLDRDVASVLEASMNVLGSAILGQPAASVSSLISSAGQQAFTAIANIWNLEPALRITWNPATWLASIPVVLYGLLGMVATVFLIAFAMCVYIANLVMSQVSIIIAMVFAPFFVPFLLFKPASWLFEGWLRFFLGAAMMKIVGLLMLKITGTMMGSLAALSQQAATQRPGVLDAASIDIILYVSMALLAGISALLMSQVPSLSTGLISGSAGGAGFSGWGNLASKSPATKAILGGMNAGSFGGGGGAAGKQGGNALSTLTQAMPNVVKPVTAMAGAGASRIGGILRAGADVRASKDSSLTAAGERNIGRDTSQMSAATAKSYTRALESRNARMAKNEGRSDFYGPPSPRYTVSKPTSSTAPRSQSKGK
jgi:type IV secretion system protein TrbL